MDKRNLDDVERVTYRVSHHGCTFSCFKTQRSFNTVIDPFYSVTR